MPSESSPSTNSETTDEKPVKESLSVIVCFLVALFGMGAWMDVNGIWVELPLLVEKLPEHWELPMYFVVVIQVANTGPLIYMLVVWLSKNKVKERGTIYLIKIIGPLSVFLLAFFWNRVVTIGDKSVSLALLMLLFCLALMDCTSSVTFLPFMATLPPVYISSLYIGMGFGGLLTGIISLVQGVGSTQGCLNQTTVDANGTSSSRLVPQPLSPRFSVSVFLGILCFLLCVSSFAFLLLDKIPLARLLSLSAGHHQSKPAHYQEDGVPLSNDEENHHDNQGDAKSKCVIVDASNHTDEETKSLTSSVKEHKPESLPVSDNTAGKQTYFYVTMTFVVIINLFINSFLPAVQTYATLPYGVSTFHITTTLAKMVNPLASFLTMWRHARSLYLQAGLMLLGLLLCAYILLCAFLSPSPPFIQSALGGPLQILAWVGVVSLWSFTKVSIGIEMRHKGRTYLRWCGILTQFGSILGAVLSLLLVNILQVFKSKPFCS